LKTQEESGTQIAAESITEGVLQHERKFRFMRNERLKGRNNIQVVFKQGKSFGCHGAKLLVRKNDLTYNRICFTFPRGFGNAVKRNRSKRLSREAYRLLKQQLQYGNDLILIIYPEIQASLTTRSGQLEFLFSKAGLLKCK